MSHHFAHDLAFVAIADWQTIADDYETLPSEDFDAKYEGWADQQTFIDRLRSEFETRRAVR